MIIPGMCPRLLNSIILIFFLFTCLILILLYNSWLKNLTISQWSCAGGSINIRCSLPQMKIVILYWINCLSFIVNWLNFLFLNLLALFLIKWFFLNC